MNWLLLLALLPATAVAQEEVPAEAVPAPAPEASPLEVRTDLRAEYIQGELVLVRFVVANTGTQSAQFADLGARPWLVRFELVDSRGKRSTWYTTPPEADPGGSWTIPSRSQRKVLLEIPSSNRLAKGRYTLTVRIQNGDQEIALPPHQFDVAPAQPVASDPLYEQEGLERYGLHTLWVHDASQGYDLYLHQGDGKDPRRTVGDFHLMHLESPVDPVLSAARPQERWSRHVVWQSTPQTVNFLRLDGQEVRGNHSHFDTPYPKVELFGRPTSDPSGGLHVPVWVPSPKGSGGELMVVSLQGREGPEYRSIARYDNKPAWRDTVVDGGGHMRLLVETRGNLDVYTVAAGSSLPGVGKRLHKPDAGGLLGASFGYLQKKEGRAGGLAVLTLVDLGEGKAEARWVSLEGSALQTLPGTTVPEGAVVTQLLPVGESYAALTNLEQVLVPGGALPLKGGADLLVAQGEAVWARSIEKGGPVKSRPVNP